MTATAVTMKRSRWPIQRRALGDTAHPGTGVVDAVDLRRVLREHPARQVGRIDAQILEGARLHADVKRALDVDAEVDLRRHGRQRRDRDGELAGSEEQIVAVA